ncbi:hypothetical protein [Komagataeibacter xylinus]|uniref:hypothetical protein n=1 Tax=Komagataeibacter xylinus TaxID=28448 RepID=UPI001031A007|nr:hypothetical protein [Komagataeibacter xylinus]
MLSPEHSDAKPIRQADLRQARMNELIDNCQQEILRQIIGPFGLSTAMFNDKDGGNVSTVHNADNDIFPDEHFRKNYSLAGEEYSQKIRQKHWDDTKRRGPVHRQNNETFARNGEVTSEATGRPMKQGEVHGDHVVSLKEFHGNKALHLRLTEQERKDLANSKQNMAFIEASLNTSKGKKSWDECLKDPDFIEKNNLGAEQISRIRALDSEARRLISRANTAKLTNELLTTGASEAGRNALQQAFGVLLHEFVNGSFVEIKLILQAPDQESLIDQIVESLKRVMKRVVAKLKSALDAAISGAIQGFASNLLTFLINNFITTAKKVVTIIRESLRGIWRAMKLMINPPEGMSTLEVAREVTKILSATITTAIGMLLEKSVSGFIAASPLAFLAPILAPALTAIITGIAASLLIYGIDRAFDWLSATGTEMLKSMERLLHSSGENIALMTTGIDLQFQSSRQYAEIDLNYKLIGLQLDEMSTTQSVMLNAQDYDIKRNQEHFDALRADTKRIANAEQEASDLINEYFKKN